MRIEKDETYCYLDGNELREAIRDEKVLDALIDVLEVPGKAVTLRTLSPKQKLRDIEKQIEHYRGSSTSIWNGVDAAEVLAASIWRSGLADRRVVDELFCGVNREEDLLVPVVDWLRESGLRAFAEVPMGRGRVDAVGYRAGGLLRGARVVAVELKNDLGQLKRGLDQMTTFRDYAHEVYLACTPALAAHYLDSHAEARGVQRWDPAVLDRKLEQFGFGLLLVEDDVVNVHLEAEQAEVAKAKFAELEAAVEGMREE